MIHCFLPVLASGGQTHGDPVELILGCATETFAEEIPSVRATKRHAHRLTYWCGNHLTNSPRSDNHSL